MKRILILIDGSAYDADSLASAPDLAILTGAELTAARALGRALAGPGRAARKIIAAAPMPVLLQS